MKDLEGVVVGVRDKGTIGVAIDGDMDFCVTGLAVDGIGDL